MQICLDLYAHAIDVLGVFVKPDVRQWSQLTVITYLLLSLPMPTSPDSPSKTTSKERSDTVSANGAKPSQRERVQDGREVLLAAGVTRQ